MSAIPAHKELLSYTDGGDMRDRIRSQGMFSIFKPLIEHYLVGEEDHETFNIALFYILMLYTKDSEAVHVGVSWMENKLAVADQLEMPPKMRKEFTELKNPALVETIHRYLDFQSSRSWAHLQMVRDLYDQMVTSAIEPASAEGMTWDQKKKNQGYANELYVEIAKWEQAVKEEEAGTEDGRKEITRKTKQSKKFSLRTEDILTIIQTEEKDKN